MTTASQPALWVENTPLQTLEQWLTDEDPATIKAELDAAGQSAPVLQQYSAAELNTDLTNAQVIGLITDTIAANVNSGLHANSAKNTIISNISGADLNSGLSNAQVIGLITDTIAANVNSGLHANSAKNTIISNISGADLNSGLSTTQVKGVINNYGGANTGTFFATTAFQGTNRDGCEAHTFTDLDNPDGGTGFLTSVATILATQTVSNTITIPTVSGMTGWHITGITVVGGGGQGIAAFNAGGYQIDTGSGFGSIIPISSGVLSIDLLSTQKIKFTCNAGITGLNALYTILRGYQIYAGN